MSDESSPLAPLDPTTLQRVVEARLHARVQCGPPIPPGAELPDDWLVEQFELAAPDLRARLDSTLRRILAALPDPEAWPPSARDAFFVLLHRCGQSVVDDVRAAIAAERLLARRDEYHLDALAGLLKCMIALRALGTPAFWIEQAARLGPRYGAVVFAGLLEHGLTPAFKALPQLCTDTEALHWIGVQLSVAVDRHGLAATSKALKSRSRELSPAARATLERELAWLGAVEGHVPLRPAEPLMDAATGLSTRHHLVAELRELEKPGAADAAGAALILIEVEAPADGEPDDPTDVARLGAHMQRSIRGRDLIAHLGRRRLAVLLPNVKATGVGRVHDCVAQALRAADVRRFRSIDKRTRRGAIANAETWLEEQLAALLGEPWQRFDVVDTPVQSPETGATLPERADAIADQARALAKRFRTQPQLERADERMIVDQIFERMRLLAESMFTGRAITRDEFEELQRVDREAWNPLDAPGAERGEHGA